MAVIESTNANYLSTLYDMEQDFFLEDGPTSERLEIVSELIMEAVCVLIPVEALAAWRTKVS